MGDQLNESGDREFESTDQSECGFDVTRRTFLSGSAATAFAIGGASTVSDRSRAQESGTNWTMFQCDAANSGSLESVQTPSGVSDRWETDTVSISYESVRTPAVADGTVYHPYDGGIRACSTDDGTREWEYSLENEQIGNPAVADGVVFVPGDDLYAVDAADGTEVWTVSIDECSSPTVVDGSVYVTTPSEVYALDAEDGSEAWSRALPSENQSKKYAPPVVDGAVLAYLGDVLYALSANDGSEEWRREIGRSDTSLTVADGTVFAIDNYRGGGTEDWRIAALDVEDGSTRWQRRLDSHWQWVSPLATGHGQLYFYSGGFDESEDWPLGLYAFDIQSGDREWVNEDVSTLERPPNPIVVGDLVVAGDEVGTMWGVNADSGDVEWDVEKQKRVNPVATDEGLYVLECQNEATNADGKVYAFDFSGSSGRRTLTIDGQGTDSRTDYEFAVSGNLEAGDGVGEGDSISGSSAEGFVQAGTDQYHFEGELESYSLDGGDAVLFVDGEQRGSADSEWRTLTLDGQGTDSRTDYEFAVSGSLRASEGVGEGDSIDGSSAEGFVQAGTDEYEFTGELESHSLDGGDAILYVGDEQRGSADSGVTIERVTPVDGEVTVAPISSSGDHSHFFEVAARNYSDGVIRTNWYVDGERIFADSLLHSDYQSRQMDFFSTAFSSTGTHEVRVVVYETSDKEEELGRTSWTVHVEDGAWEAPTVTYADPEDQIVEIEGTDESRDFTLSASDPNGDLHRSIWWIGIDDDLLGTRDLSGARDEATLTASIFPGAIIFVWVTDERGMETLLPGWNVVTDDSWRDLTIDGNGTDDRTDYTFEVSRALEAGKGVGEGDSIDGASAEGFVQAGVDRYHFRGELESSSLDGGDAVLLVDGEQRDSADGGSEWRTLTLDGQGTDSRTDYDFEVSGDLEAGEGVGEGDSISGSSAEGFVQAGTDEYRFTGSLRSSDLTGGDAVLLVDGEQRDSAQGEWQALTLDGQGTDSRTDYEFTVSGSLRASEGVGEGDSINGPSAEGFVQAGTDEYEFTGVLASSDLTGGDAVLYVEGEERDSADGGPEWRTLTLDGQGTDSRTDYEFAVSGDLEAGDGVGDGDSISGSNAEGFVQAGTDEYRFTGSLRSSDLTGGDAVLLIDGERRDSADGGSEWRSLTLDGQGTDSRTDYEFAVSGDLEAGGGVGEGDSISGSSAEGFVQAGTDEYRFTGSLRWSDLTGGDAALLVDGVQVASADG